MGYQRRKHGVDVEQANKATQLKLARIQIESEQPEVLDECLLFKN